MKLLLIALTLTLSAQTFASECSLLEKKSFISAEKVLCDNNLGQVLLEGIKITRFGKEKNVLVNHKNRYDFYKTATNICKAFGLKSAAELEGKTIFSYLNTGLEIQTEYDSEAQKEKFLFVEKTQTGHVYPIQSIICNR